MDKCARVEQIIQSYIDGEQSASERVIIEKHFAECGKCRAVLEAQRRCTADLFETFSMERLRGTLTPYVMEHLPEMIDLNEGKRDLAEVNQRAKHPRPWREYSLRLAPAAAIIVLVFLGYTLIENWPETVVSDQTVGSVTSAAGMSFRILHDTDEQTASHLKTIALPGDRFETASDSTTMLTLVGPTHVKLAPNTRVLVKSNRRISVEKGSVYLSVAKAERMFRVFTPSGNVTVFGTEFDVNVDSGTTTVAVREGEVQVESGELFTQLKPGEEVEFTSESRTLVPRHVAISTIAPWADAIIPDVEALQFFTAKVAPASSTGSLIQAESGFVLSSVNGNRIGYVEVEWSPTRLGVTPMGYQVYVFDSVEGKLLFKGVISSDTISRESSIRIYNRTSPDARSEFAYVKVVPNYETGQGETKFTNVRAGLVQ